MFVRAVFIKGYKDLKKKVRFHSPFEKNNCYNSNLSSCGSILNGNFGIRIAVETLVNT